MNNKTKNIIIFSGVGLASGYSLSKFIFRRPSAHNLVSSIAGLILGAAFGYISSEKELVGEGNVDAESKKNKIVFTRED